MFYDLEEGKTGRGHVAGEGRCDDHPLCLLAEFWTGHCQEKSFRVEARDWKGVFFTTALLFSSFSV